MAQLQILPYGIASQIQVAIFHTDVITSVRIVLDGERGCLGGIEYVQLRHNDFNVPRGHIGVLAITLVDDAFYLNHILAPKVISLFAEVGVHFFIEHQLGNAVAVTKVDESHTSHLAASLNPSGQRHLFIDIGDAQLSAGVCSVHFSL